MTETMMKTTTDTIASTFPVEYYSRKLLKTLKSRLVYANFGQKRSIPANNGSTIQFRKYSGWDGNTTPLTEGVIPDSLTMTQTDITATVKEYGDWVSLSSKATLTALDPILNDAVELLGARAEKSIDMIIRDELKNATNVIFAEKAGTPAASASAITPEHILTTKEIRKAVRFLKKRNADPFYRNGKPYYYCIVDPSAEFDLQSDPKWEAVATYQQAEKFENGELGRMYGVVFIASSEAIKWTGAGASSADVYGSIVFGPDAYGQIDIEGNGAIEVYVESGGGVSDPLHQKKTVGYKIPAFCAKLLDNDRIVMIKYGVSA